MAAYLLHHRHQPRECGVAFAAWQGHSSPLRSRPTFGSCRSGDHQIWWVVDAPDPGGALEQLPHFVAARTEVVEVSELVIP